MMMMMMIMLLLLLHPVSRSFPSLTADPTANYQVCQLSFCTAKYTTFPTQPLSFPLQSTSLSNIYCVRYCKCSIARIVAALSSRWYEEKIHLSKR
jgi:hypothetical protein